MTRKSLVILGMAAIIAASTGVAFAKGGSGMKSAQTAKETTAVSEEDHADNNSAEEYYPEEYDDGQAAPDVTETAGETDETVTQAQENDPESQEDGEEDAPDQGEDRELTAHYTITQVLDHSSGTVVSPQVAFGKFYRSCYLDLYSDSTFALCLNPTTGVAQSGTYSTDDENMYVSFGGDRETSFKLTRDAGGNITAIIYADNEYIIYFG